MSQSKPIEETLIEQNEFCRIVFWPKTGGYGVYDLKDPTPHRTRSLAHARKVFFRWTTRLKREAVNRRR